jgi:outer membrane biosynthesis protein TonB
VRPLQVMQRRRSALVSVVGHAAFIALLALVGTRPDRGSSESPLIMAELITALEPAESSPATVVPEALEAPAQESTPAPQPATELETETPAPPPPPQPEAEPEPVAPRAVEQSPEPPPIEQVAEVEEPATEQPVEPVPEPPSDAELETTRPATETVVDDAPRRSFASNEEQSVRRKLSSWTGSFETANAMPTMKWRDDGQEYTAVLKRSSAAEAMGMEQLLVELTTERDGERLVTELRMTRLAFSNFGQFVNRWDPDVGLNEDVIDGRFHSNTAVKINRTGRASPVFGGKVTIAGGDVISMAEGFVATHPARLNKRKLFPAGLETHARRIELPDRAAALEAVAGPDNSQRFAHDTALTFHDDGSVSWHEPDGAETRRALGGEPFYLMADEDVELEVSGTVNGKVLVYTPDRIVVTGDIRYAADPRTPHADDYLGLVAERTVEIAEPEVTGSGDLEIFASIYARQRFVVRDFMSRRSGTLIVHGSLTAGTLSASEPRFATRVEFDDRLTTMRAPGFPLSDRYELDSTSGEWRVLDTR